MHSYLFCVITKIKMSCFPNNVKPIMKNLFIVWKIDIIDSTKQLQLLLGIKLKLFKTITSIFIGFYK